ncbi:type 1 fimbrial protein [Pseudomonas sp. CCM 7893]|uniref:Type 1 fimbrial protein n=1 Tax=Pseudomonas spelaei TaxID=1055469 RepID=A0A6I3W0L0_9PSED|nr:fimbrial protein [Pseudomonas spelaei]MUF03655.1 type 1 fimbrial protein [Pseudomonas spelaei]
MKRVILKTLAASGLAIVAVTPCLSFATDGVINFSGSITDVTCDINGKAPGEGNITNVDLGRTTPATFVSVGTASTFVPFKLQLSGSQCTNKAKVAIDFEQIGNIDPVTGNLKLIGSAPAQGVQIQIYNDTKDGKKILLGQAETAPQVATIAGNTATLSYKASYVSTAAAVTAGSGISYVRYTLSYQ